MEISSRSLELISTVLVGILCNFHDNKKQVAHRSTHVGLLYEPNASLTIEYIAKPGRRRLTCVRLEDTILRWLSSEDPCSRQPLNGSVETMQLLAGLVRKTLASETSRRDGKLGRCKLDGELERCSL